MSAPDLSAGGMGTGTENGNTTVVPEPPGQWDAVVPDVPDPQDNEGRVARASRGDGSRDGVVDPTGNTGPIGGHPDTHGAKPTQGAFFDEAPAIHDDGSEVERRG